MNVTFFAVQSGRVPMQNFGALSHLQQHIFRMMSQASRMKYASFHQGADQFWIRQFLDLPGTTIIPIIGVPNLLSDPSISSLMAILLRKSGSDLQKDISTKS